MRTRTLFALLVVLAVALAATITAAEDVTLSGSIMCAKCTLKKADAKECQDVLVVTEDGGAKKEYYLAKNAVLEKFGHTCTGEKAAVVTGQVAEKDGKTWLTATKIQAKQ
jgi:hypothetical protein